LSNVVCITISLDRQTLETLDKVTINRSAYIRQMLHDKWGSFQVPQVVEREEKPVEKPVNVSLEAIVDAVRGH